MPILSSWNRVRLFGHTPYSECPLLIRMQGGPELDFPFPFEPLNAELREGKHYSFRVFVRR